MKTFTVVSDNTLPQPGLNFTAFILHLKGEKKLISGDRLYVKKNPPMTILIETEWEPDFYLVKFVNKDPNAYFPPVYTKAETIFVLKPSFYTDTSTAWGPAETAPGDQPEPPTAAT